MAGGDGEILPVPHPACLRRSRIFSSGPHRPGAVKRLRRSYALLRPLRDDCAVPMWRSCFHGLWRAEPAARPARSAKIVETNGLSRAEESMSASETSKPRSGRAWRDIDAEHGSGSVGSGLLGFQYVNPAAPFRERDAHVARGDCHFAIASLIAHSFAAAVSSRAARDGVLILRLAKYSPLAFAASGDEAR